MIRQQGSHRGKSIVFGFDRHLAPESDDFVQFLEEYGQVLPVGARDRVPHYLTSTEWVSRRVQGSASHVGVLVCSTGIGVSIAANKFSGVYAARCLTVEDAQFARVINNANVLCLASRTDRTLNRRIIDAFLTVPYEGRSIDQLATITTLEHETPLAAE